MKQKIPKVFLFSLILSLFFLPILSFAQTIGGDETNCKITISSMEASPTTIYKTTQVNFIGTAQINNCGYNLDLNFDFYTSPDGNPRRLWTCIAKSPHPSTIQFTCPYDFSQYPDWGDLSNPKTLPYYLQISSSANRDYGDTKSWGKAFVVSQTPLGEGFTFSVSPASPAFGSNVTINYTDFPPGATGQIFVNDKQHYVNVYSSGNSIPVTTQNGFVQTGSNSLEIVLNDQNGKQIYDQTYSLTLESGSGGGGLNSSCTLPANNCSAHLECDANNTCVQGIEQGHVCDPNNDNCDSDNNLICTAGSNNSYTCQTAANGTTDKPKSGGSNNTATVMYGCQAANGIYTCSANKNDSGLAACSSVGQISPADKCGCSDANYSAGTCKNGQTVTPGSGTGQGGVGTVTPNNTPPPNCTPGGADANNPLKCLQNPLPEDSLTQTFLVIIKGFLGIIAVWAVIFIIVGGFQMVMAAGSEEVYTKAKKTILWAVLGLVIALMSFTIVAVVQNILQTTGTANAPVNSFINNGQ